jgi:hypothetical protein
MNTNQWCMDTGATDHMCPVKRLFQRYQALDEPRAVWTAGGHKLIAKGIGDVPVLAFNGQTWVKKVLTEVLYVPGSQHFLMSMAKTLDRGCRVLADGDSVRFTRDDETVAIGQRKGQKREWELRNYIQVAVTPEEARATRTPFGEAGWVSVPVEEGPRRSGTARCGEKPHTTSVNNHGEEAAVCPA